ncbi:MAG: Smr/MutS family protein [Limnochordaceae bacterium]|nr:Smr/MutS family protein [Limnochordaceae bacterium]
MADAAEGMGRLREFFAEKLSSLEDSSALRPWADGLPDASALVRTLRTAIGPNGEVLDSASPELAAVRQRLRRAIQRVHEALESLVRSPLGRQALQEPIVTHRMGRYVVPVRQECRDMVPGIVHDASGSGATLFVEPLSVVQANNVVRTEQASEQAEVERILRRLTREVAQAGQALEQGLATVGEVDAIVARARLGIDQRAVAPVLTAEPSVVLRQARHPLLTGPVVPIDVEVGRSFRILVVTGPNTGGKTVALKTVGLLTLMAQAGLHVPAEPGTEIGLFTRVRADIGDQQSVSNNLSTFSSHMQRIIPMLQEADEHTLVLLDELGAGTDPEEGGALGCAILQRLLERKARVIVTTHLTDLKLMAHATPGMANASVSFDTETLQPTYRVVLGAPGQSQAIAIARRLGLPPEVVEEARRRLGAERVRADALIAELQQALDAARRRLEEATAARDEARLHARHLQAELEKARRRRQEVVQRAMDDAQAWARRARLVFESLVEEGKKAAKEGRIDEVRRLRRQFAVARAGLEEQGMRLLSDGGSVGAVEEPVAAAAGPAVGGPVEEPGALQVGQRVWVAPLRCAGVVMETADPQGQVLVQAGAVRTRVPARQLSWVIEAGEGQAAGEGGTTGTAAAAAGAAGAGQARGLGFAKATSVSPEIDLRGRTVEEATAELDKYLDDCTLAGVERVRIIHGKGTGALREAVRAYLARSTRVRTYAPGEPAEGGDGVTVVRLA